MPRKYLWGIFYILVPSQSPQSIHSEIQGELPQSARDWDGLMFFSEDNGRARWLEAVPSSPRSHDLLHSPQQNLPLDSPTLLPCWLRKTGLDPLWIPTEEPPHFQTLEGRPWKTRERKLWGGGGTGLDTKCQVLQTGVGTQGQEAGRSRPGRSRPLSRGLGRETGLAPGVPALMSWKQEEMAQHVKAS